MGVPVIDDRLLRADLRNQRIAHKTVLMHRLSRGCAALYLTKSQPD
ncbi:GNAT family acetyltransferase [Ligilactobacillus ruminis]|uniref:GNAT family acetyltransferase n=1 Tax=Ligilactobacillus ruminis TaxID=1623 RepID=A0A8B2Z1I0_9LACO|nr:GNAT family acetyltransferase [Ligilactobacillus ruminis]